jgi:malonyl-CoA decarboxylase
MVEATKAGFLDRTLRNLRNAWQSIAGAEYGADTASMRPNLPDDDIPRLRDQMLACLAQGRRGLGPARAAAWTAYLNLDETGRAAS